MSDKDSSYTPISYYDGKVMIIYIAMLGWTPMEEK